MCAAKTHEPGGEFMNIKTDEEVVMSTDHWKQPEEIGPQTTRSRRLMWQRTNERDRILFDHIKSGARQARGVMSVFRFTQANLRRLVPTKVEEY